MATTHAQDILIVGGGAAGLTAALRLANNYQVTVISKGPLSDASTSYAQGGIAAVLDDKDSIESHVQDTLIAGAGLCHENVVRFTIERSKLAIDWLIEQGVQFTERTQKDGKKEYHLTREGGHSHRRIIHAADATGKAVSTTLSSIARSHPNIRILEHYTAVDIIQTQTQSLPSQCSGIYAYNNETQEVDTFLAKATILATGGASKVYLYTSNPDVASGDGIAMAWRAGCRVANMEFNQFHPTCLFHPKARSFLLTEAIRGEGGRLLLPDGEPFMHRFDPRGELAPRDIVARAIDHEMKRLGVDCLYLDISHKPVEFIQSHFPTIYQRCLELNLDMTKTPLPIVPAAHYTCGGVLTDLQGKTDLTGLYAIGETAFTGLHGANRMASNSLLECLVFAGSAAEDIQKTLPELTLAQDVPPWDESQVTDSDEEIVVSHNWHELRRFMWDYVGIVRTNKRLERAMHRIDLLKQEINDYYSNFKVTHDLLELRNLVVIAELIVRCAQMRKESRGLHYTLDYPTPLADKAIKDTVLTPYIL